MAILISIVTFVIVAWVVYAVWALSTGDVKKDVVRERLDAVRSAEQRGSNKEQLKIIRDEMLSALPWLNRVLLNWNWVGSLKNYIHQAGMTVRPARVVLLCGVLALGVYNLASYFSAGTALSLFSGVIIGVSPIIFIAIKRRRRLRKFEENFPEALDLLGRAVRAGHAFTTGLELIAEECSSPIAEEFRTTFEEQNLGLPLRDTLLNLTERVPLVDVRMFVTALMIQKDTGGNLVEILDELARVIRERFRIYRDVKVKTAQGRLTAMILIAMPFIMIGLLGGVNSSYIKILFTDPTGQTMLMVAAGLQVIGSLILWKIVHIDV